MRRRNYEARHRGRSEEQRIVDEGGAPLGRFGLFLALIALSFVLIAVLSVVFPPPG